jgi:hypothetical protein
MLLSKTPSDLTLTTMRSFVTCQRLYDRLIEHLNSGEVCHWVNKDYESLNYFNSNLVYILRTHDECYFTNDVTKFDLDDYNSFHLKLSTKFFIKLTGNDTIDQFIRKIEDDKTNEISYFCYINNDTTLRTAACPVAIKTLAIILAKRIEKRAIHEGLFYDLLPYFINFRKLAGLPNLIIPKRNNQ